MFGYVSDDDERPRSPRLERVFVKYTPPSSPISFVPRRRPMTDSASGAQQRSRKRGRVRPSQGDVVLLGHLDPNRPDIAATAGRQTFLPSDSASDKAGTNEETDDETEDEESGPQHARTELSEDDDSSPAGNEPDVDARDWEKGDNSDRKYNAEDDFGPHRKKDSQSNVVDGDKRDCTGGPNKARRVTKRRQTSFCACCNKRPSQCSFDDNCKGGSEFVVSQRHTDGVLEHGRQRKLDDKMDVEMVDSPTTDVLKFSEAVNLSPKLPTHSASDAPPSSRNAETTSSSLATAANPQEQSLPSIQHLVRVAETQDEVFLRRPRTESTSSINSALVSNASSYAATATPGSATSAHFYVPKASNQTLPSLAPLSRTVTDPTPLPLPVPYARRTNTNPANFAMQTTSNAPYAQPMPSNASVTSTSTVGATPGSLNDAPTPSDRSSTLSLPVSPVHSTHAVATAQIAIGSSSSPLYKCPHPGCQAAPFQTPYLLNSHRNVHSSDRPYFCPRKDCPRSQPGKGFKRKNEMLRHGLVHDSPGYVCPFCSPEKEHRYPRPDNLQRHVKMHHEDVDPEDSRLREVLGQRRMTISGTSSGTSATLENSIKGSIMIEESSTENDSLRGSKERNSRFAVDKTHVQRGKAALTNNSRNEISGQQRADRHSGTGHANG